MGCHLHDLIDAVHQNKLLFPEPINDQDCNEIKRVFNLVAPHAICFDMGDIDEFPEITPVYELAREPFPDCWFEFNFKHTDGKSIILGMLVTVRDQVQITSFRKKQKEWMVRGVIFTDSLSSSKGYEIYPALDIVAKELKEHKLVLSTFLSALNCNNIKQVEHKPNKKLQNTRQKRGKQPLFSHWTLELSLPPKSSKGNSTLNGTHASPRVHLRRGHPRQYSPGKWTWVQACVVGRNGKGIVTKDYSAKFECTQQADHETEK